ncbi:MAG: succinate dehydrogenase cytochrome b subunit [Calditrichae bacterium]|nr:succinate dehydrogenase cytochrome b subunit [Calditrichota bacterium]MCB9057764.1 succinate dehydrogenase cytochrome b subunit [Calditrichia bacterium]
MQFTQVFGSTIGKKLLLGVTGLSWAGFAIGHLVGNLQLLYTDPTPFNKYAHFLTSLGGLLYFVESVLVLSLLLHFLYAIKVTLENKKARPDKYEVHRSAKGVSKRGFSTASMIYTGLLLFIFLIIHINNFKYGTFYTTMIDGKEVRDLYKTVYEYYSNPVNVFYYVAMMILLGTHLSHGFWSAFQSLGINGKRFTPFIYSAGTVVAVLLAVGFVFIPVYIYYMGGV